jgi:lysine-N-methylase
MQVDAKTVEIYRIEAPELLEAITTLETPSSEQGEATLAPAKNTTIMKRDPATDYCIKFDAGWCGIHKSRGTDFLGDACHFFPRITRQLGDITLQTASPSCPEVARLALLSHNTLHYHPTATDRLPNSLRNYLPEGLSAEAALAVHQAFLHAVDDDTASAGQILGRIVSVSHSLPALSYEQWPDAAAFYLKTADSRLPALEKNHADPFNLFFTLSGLVAATTPSRRPRLDAVMAEIQNALGMDPALNPALGFQITPQHLAKAQALSSLWQQHAASLQLWLKNWLRLQLSAALYPFSGFGETLPQRATLLALRYAILKLALSAALQSEAPLQPDSFIRIVQSLARFLDHLADPTLSLRICEELGLMKISRLLALLVDN